MLVNRKSIEVFEVNGREFLTIEEARTHLIRCIVQDWADKHSVGRGGEWSQDMIVTEIIDTFPFEAFLEAKNGEL